MDTDPRLSGDRIEFDNPWLELLSLPLAVAVAGVFGASPVGRLFLIPFQIQFHELGHALVAWLSSRVALPLPFGFTFWREDPSWFTGGCMLFLIGVLAVYALRERRVFGVFSAFVLLVAFVLLSWVMSADRSRMVVLIGGLAGELVLSSALLVAFYFPLPDRLRWDFFRFLLLVPAAGTWMAAVGLWRGVASGTRMMPIGSLIGTTGDGSGDLDRLIGEYGFTEHALATLYGQLSLSSVLLVAVAYCVFALRAGRKLGFVPAWD